MGLNDLEKQLMDCVSADRLWRDLEKIVTWDRLSGTDGERQCARYIVDSLRALGIPVEVHEFDAYLSHPRRASLKVSFVEGGQKVERELNCITHAFSPCTPPGGVTGEMVSVGKGEPGDYQGRDVAGKVVLVDALATPEKAILAERAGAAGAIFVSQEKVLHEMILTTIWGTPAPEDLADLPRMPGLSVVKADGEWLAQLASRGRVTVNLQTETSTAWRRVLLPVASIPGRSDEFLLVGGHYDAWYFGATDNGTGNACMMELARVFWENRDKLERSLKIAWWPGHSPGRYAGSTWFADHFWGLLDEKCIGYLNVDNPGVRGAYYYFPTATLELQAFVSSVIKDAVGQEAPVTLPGKNADESFWGLGFPSLALYVEVAPDSPERGEVGGSGQGWWWHSPEDTIDKCDKTLLAVDTRTHVVAILRMLNSETLPYDLKALAAAVRNRVAELQSSAAGTFDLSEVVRGAEQFSGAVAAFEGSRGSVPARQVNAALHQAVRLLNPVLYTRRGRFLHDRTVPTPLFPGLERLPDLARLDPASDDYRFLYAGLVRERNRVAHALRSAAAVLADAAGSVTLGG